MDKSHITLLQSPPIQASAISTRCLLDNPIELCDGLKLLLQEKHNGNTSCIKNEEIVAIKLFEYKCISTKEHTFLPLTCLYQPKSVRWTDEFQNAKIEDIHHLK